MDAFESALRQETNIRDGRIAAWKAAEAFRDRAGNLHVMQSELEKKLQCLRHAERECEEAGQRQMKAKTNLDTAVAARRAHLAFKPGMVDAVFSRGRAYHNWREKDLRLASAVTSCEDQCTEAGLTFEAREIAKQELAGAAARLSDEVERQRAELARQEEAVRALREQPGSSYPDLKIGCVP